MSVMAKMELSLDVTDPAFAQVVKALKDAGIPQSWDVSVSSNLGRAPELEQTVEPKQEAPKEEPEPKATTWTRADVVELSEYTLRRLRAARKKLSQTQLGLKLGVPQTLFSKVERGVTHRVSAKNLAKINEGLTALGYR